MDPRAQVMHADNRIFILSVKKCFSWRILKGRQDWTMANQKLWASKQYSSPTTSMSWFGCKSRIINPDVNVFLFTNIFQVLYKPYALYCRCSTHSDVSQVRHNSLMQRGKSDGSWNEDIKSEISVSEPFPVEETLWPEQNPNTISQFHCIFLNIQNSSEQLQCLEKSKLHCLDRTLADCSLNRRSFRYPHNGDALRMQQG